MSGSGPNNHSTTAAILNSRQIEYEHLQLSNLLINFEDEWAILQSLCGNHRKIMKVEAAKTLFREVMGRSYDTEKKFDLALFFAIRRALLGRAAAESTWRVDRNRFALPTHPRVKIARQVTHSSLGLVTKLDSHNDIPQSYFDHAIVVEKLHVGEGPRSVDNVFGTVELKTRSTNCRPFDISCNVVSEPDLRSDHGAFTQALAYTLDNVVHCRVRCGIQSEAIPIVVLACQKAGSNSERLACVVGQLSIPEQAGMSFNYSILGYVEFDYEGHYHDLSVAYYLHAINEGIQAAIMIANNPRPTSGILCGRRLQIGHDEFALSDWKLIASPVRRARTEHDKRIKINQGELFAGDVDLATLEAAVKSEKPHLWFLDDDAPHDVQAVVLKVSSIAMHKILVRPYKSFDALKDLSKVESTRRALSKVLLAAVKPSDESVITIMKDLTDAANSNFQALSPKELIDSNVSKVQLWNSFSTLVAELLLPMAHLDFVHVDIRPGWDDTSNILCCRDTLKLLLIDYESVCQSDVAVYADKRCFHRNYDKQSLRQSFRPGFRFLWWQIMTVAYAWIDEKDQKEQQIGRLVDFLRGVGSPESTVLYQNFERFFQMDEWNLLTSLARQPASPSEDIDERKIWNTLDCVKKALERPTV